MKSHSLSAGRNSNIELLRTLSMLMIIAYHYSIYGFYPEDIGFTPNKYFVDIFGMSGKVGTDIFVLITGYYMVKSQFTVKKLLSLMGQIWFYTVPALLVYRLCAGPGSLWPDIIIHSLFPLLKSHYWFVSYYVVLMLLSPFLNALILRLNRTQHALLCILLFALCSFMPEILHIYFANGYLPLFVALYVCAAYCRLHIKASPRGGRWGLCMAVLLYLLCIAKICLTDLRAQQAADIDALAASVNFMGSYSPLAFCIAVLLLIWLSSVPPRSSKAAFMLGGASFGVYLLHENYFVSSYLWQDLFRTAEFASSPWLFAHAFAVLLLIYLAGFISESLRKAIFEPPWNKFIAFLSPKLECCLVKLSDKAVCLVQNLFCN